MYPKVKVIQDEEYDDPPSLYDHPSTSPEHKDGYTPPYVRVPISSSLMGKVNRKVAETNSKSSSVLPPRAVLSSPVLGVV
ncbi:uncharacterized protein LOC143612020 isoform X2 [Bidens hawaiensis]|uniref:uncharacterized protein LOC143612020 isoform X2 n=1 Tax=Bidens hawaiensis TaxID=980011 RepID=UPI00404B5ED6